MIFPLIAHFMPLAIGALVAIVLWLTPRLTRPDLYFALTVPPEFRDTPEGRVILHRYRRELIGVCIPAWAVLAALATTSALRWLPFALFFQLVACFAVYYRARRLVLPHAVAPSTIREARIGGSDRRVPGGWLAAAGPFAVLAACAAYLWLHWAQIPTRLIVHWDAAGQPDRWAARGVRSVFFPLLSTTTALAVLTFIRYGIALWLRPINTRGASGARESRFRNTTSVLLLVLAYFLALQAVWISIQPLLRASHPGLPAGGALLLLPLIIVIVITVILMWLGQGGSRHSTSQISQPGRTAPVGDRTEDRFWKLGVFYFNRDDPAMLVEKRFGIGYTINFAHPAAWAILLVLVLLPIVIAHL